MLHQRCPIRMVRTARKDGQPLWIFYLVRTKIISVSENSERGYDPHSFLRKYVWIIYPQDNCY